MSDGRLPRQRPHWVVTTLLLAGVLLAIAVGWVVVRGIGAVDNLRGIADDGVTLKGAIAEAEYVQAKSIATRIAARAQSARTLTSDPVWRTFEVFPWIGVNFTAVREAAEVADDAISGSLAPVVAVASDIDLAHFGLIQGTMELGPLAEVESRLRGPAASLSNAASRAVRIDADATIAPVSEMIHDLQEAVTDASGAVGTLHGASVLLPAMLGSDGPRTYVVVVQNNAELRSAGGTVGALVLLRAEAGVISLVRSASPLDLPPREPVAELSDPVIALFGEDPARTVQNTTSVPDFTEAAPLIATMWQSTFGDTVDGVLAMDVQVAAHLLEATGPVTAGPLALDDETVVDALASEISLTSPDQATRDALFVGASAAILDAARAAPPADLMVALAASAAERRIRIWSVHPEEQKILAASTLGGALPDDLPDSATVGVLINDTTGGMMDYYTDPRFTVAVGECHGEPTTRVTIRWSNNAPADAASLPSLVTGDGGRGVPPGDIGTLVAVYGPTGSSVDRAVRDGQSEADQRTTWDARPLVQFSIVLAPGESREVTVDFRGPGAGLTLTELRHTPLIGDPEPAQEKLRCD